jgi:hypothetical protein
MSKEGSERGQDEEGSEASEKFLHPGNSTFAVQLSGRSWRTFLRLSGPCCSSRFCGDGDLAARVI